MNQTTDIPPPTGDQPSPDPSPSPPPGRRTGGETYDRVTAQLRALRRSRSERVVAGVCGGVARGLGLDPVLIRVLVAVLAVIGGAGFVLYAVGWLLLAEDDGRPSVAQRAGTRTTQPGVGRPVLLAAVLVVVALLAVSDLVDSWDGWVLLVLAVAALVLWIDRRADAGAAAPSYGPGQAGAPAPAVEPGPAFAAARPTTPTTSTATYPSQTYAPTGYAATGYAATGYASTSYSPPGYASTSYSPPGYSAPAPATSGPPAPRRPRSLLLAGTLSCVLIGMGVLATVQSSGTDVPDAAYPALALALVGAGLVLGAWFGRSRGLILVGLVLALATGAAAGADRLDGFDGERVDAVLRPLTVAELPGTADYGAGQVTYDLSAVDFASPAVVGRPVVMDLSMGVGGLVVVVPRDVDVTVEADAGVGELIVFGRNDSGLGNSQTVTDLGGDGPGGGALQLSVSSGIGAVEVRRG